MAHKIFLTETAKEEYSSLEPTNRKALAKAIKSLTKKPFQGFELHGEMAAYRSLNVMRYRMVFLVEKESIIVCGITRRANLYAHLGRNIMQMS